MPLGRICSEIESPEETFLGETLFWDYRSITGRGFMITIQNVYVNGVDPQKTALNFKKSMEKIYTKQQISPRRTVKKMSTLGRFTCPKGATKAPCLFIGTVP